MRINLAEIGNRKVKDQMKILVVDDSLDNTKLLTQILEDHYQVDAVNSGEECLDLVKKERYDLILLDVMMPNMNGYEVLKQLVMNQETALIPVIFLSAKYKDSDRIVKGLELGAFDYITKPIDEEELLARIRVVLRIKESEEKVRQNNIALRALNDELGALSYSVSHDLRAPLRVIEGMTKILLEDHGSSLSAEVKNCIKRIISANDLMVHHLEDLLNITRVSSSQFNQQPVNISRLVEQVIFDLNIPTEKVRIDNKFDDNFVVYADKRLLYLVYFNLIGNAYKYSRKAKLPKIETGFQLIDGKKIYYVSDNGVGFDMTYRTKIFNPFYRLHRQVDFEGSGIGLAIVQRAIHRHGGTVWPESSQDKGTTFYFTLTPDTKHWNKVDESIVNSTTELD